MIKDKLDEIGQFVINELGKELIKQDHKATGELIASLDYKTEIGTDLFSIIIEMNDYGRYVNTGRKRGAKKVPIKALIEWVKQKGIETNNKKAIGVAFAIQKTIQKQGVPTINSRKKGKRTGFVDDTIERIGGEIENRLSDAAEKEIDVYIDNLVKGF
jgi:hypothetical protein